MVEAFDLIEFFAVASLFGWLTFSGLTETEREKKAAKRDKENELEKENAKRNLNTIRGYFFISFIFYAMSASSDYFFHHPSLLGVIFPSYTFAVGTIVSFVFGTTILVLPLIVIQLVGWERLGSTHVPPIDYVLGFSLPAVVSTTLVLSIFTSSWAVRAILVSSGFFPYLGLYFAWKYYPLKGRRRIFVALLGLVPWVALAISVLTGTSWWRIT